MMAKARTDPFDELQYEAESQVQKALMDTPEVKKEVKRTKAALKVQRAETKKNVRASLGKKKGRK